MTQQPGDILSRRRGRFERLRVQILQIGPDLALVRVLAPATPPHLRCWFVENGKLWRRFEADRGPDALKLRVDRRELREIVRDLELIHSCRAVCRRCRALTR